MLQTFLPHIIATVLFPRTRDVVYRPDDVSVSALNHAVDYVKTQNHKVIEGNYHLSTEPTKAGTWLKCNKKDATGLIKFELSVKIDNAGNIAFAELSTNKISHLRYSSELEITLPKQITEKINEICRLDLGKENTHSK